MSIGQRLKKLRVSMKKTLREEGAIFNVSLNTVYRWEHDLSAPRKSTLRKVAEFYGVSYEWILGGREAKGIDEYDDYTFDFDDPEMNIDHKILKMISKFSNNNKYKIMGYIERMCVEAKEREKEIKEAEEAEEKKEEEEKKENE